MTVEQLIEYLQSIEDKSITVFAKIFEENQDRIIQAEEIRDNDLHYVLLS